MRPEVVAGQPISGLGWQRQSPIGVEPTCGSSGDATVGIRGARGGGEGHRLVAAPARPLGQRWRHR